MNGVKKLGRWHKTRPGFLVFGLAELALAYLFVSLAINSGSLWQWALSIVFVFGGLSNFVRLATTHKK